MTFIEFAATHDIEIVIRRIPRRDEWIATLTGVGVVDGPGTRYDCGRGAYPSEALADLQLLLAGKRLMMNGHEFNAPDTWTT